MQRKIIITLKIQQIVKVEFKIEGTCIGIFKESLVLYFKILLKLLLKEIVLNQNILQNFSVQRKKKTLKIQVDLKKTVHAR